MRATVLEIQNYTALGGDRRLDAAVEKISELGVLQWKVFKMKHRKKNDWKTTRISLSKRTTSNGLNVYNRRH